MIALLFELNLTNIRHLLKSQIIQNKETEQNRKIQKQYKFSKENFAKMMSKRRQSLFNVANDQIEKAVESAENFLIYLNLKSQFGYTVTNTLLVMAQNSKATQLKEISPWREDNKYIRKGQKGIQILERVYYDPDSHSLWEVL